ALVPDAAGAAEPSGFPFLQPYFTAVAALERHEVAALALTLGTIFFAVVTAIALLRTHARAARAQATARAEIARLRDDIDRATALLLSEPQVVIAWTAAEDEPEIFADPTILTAAPPHRRLL